MRVLLIFTYHAVRVAAPAVIWFNWFVRSRREEGDPKTEQYLPARAFISCPDVWFGPDPPIRFHTYKFYRAFGKQTSVSVGNYNEFKSTLNALYNLMDSKLVCIIWVWPSECIRIIPNWEITFHRQESYVFIF